jgi:hypothetical protein
VETVWCKTHGAQPQTLVCQHIAEGLIERKRLGFFWTTASPDNPRPDAWCADCESRVRATGGEWTGEALERLAPEALCGECYDLAKRFHMGKDPWS